MFCFFRLTNTYGKGFRDSMKKHIHHFTYAALLLGFLLTACGTAVSSATPQQTATVNPSFQAQLSPVPTAPPYRCGAWASNNAPGAGSTIQIYARLTKDTLGVSGMTAQAVVHFQNFDAPLDSQTTDDGGFVTFPLSLEGRQPRQVPATVDVTFSVSGKNITCTAFFTPR
jgi:hypothetical protein